MFCENRSELLKLLSCLQVHVTGNGSECFIRISCQVLCFIQIESQTLVLTMDIPLLKELVEINFFVGV